MGLFNWKKEGGLTDQIRCDEKDYLIWKWRPKGHELNSTSRENAIRWGTSLSVSNTEIAVFVYRQKDGTVEEYIEGPADKTLSTANLPILASLIGLAYDGGTPFQAEVYFFNLKRAVQFDFRVPYFDVYDPRTSKGDLTVSKGDLTVPISVEGSVTLGLEASVEGVKKFISVNGLDDFMVADFEEQIYNGLMRLIKQVVANAPSDLNLPVTQLDRRIYEISEHLESLLRKDIESDFGIELKRLDISVIDIDKSSSGYKQIVRLSELEMERREKTAQADIETTLNQTYAKSEVIIDNLRDTQRIGAENMEEQLRLQREAYERNQKLQTESSFFETHKLNIQTEAQRDVLKSAAESLGQMGAVDLGSGGGTGFNPAGMMTGMAMGGAMGTQMSNMMNQMGNTMMGGGPGQQVPPPPPQSAYMIVLNGQSSGPFNMSQLAQFVSTGQMQKSTYVWKQGMPNWAEAGVILELQSLFTSNPSVPPPIPPPPSK